MTNFLRAKLGSGVIVDLLTEHLGVGSWTWYSICSAGFEGWVGLDVVDLSLGVSHAIHRGKCSQSFLFVRFPDHYTGNNEELEIVHRANKERKSDD
eukprot:TCALIF_05900-PA protein Name:"Protein of unknown function" AED:0.99 eAED:1.00 QI:0/0/0/0.5/1/1/2/0/95